MGAPHPVDPSPDIVGCAASQERSLCPRSHLIRHHGRHLCGPGRGSSSDRKQRSSRRWTPMGALDGLPFMPEMLAYCGQTFRVFKRADKTCDTVGSTAMRRLHDTVHLEMLRCDGSAHGGCQAECLLYWKEAWLARVDPGSSGQQATQPAAMPGRAEGPDRQALIQLTDRRTVSSPPSGRYYCQATELPSAVDRPAMVGADAVRPRCPIGQRQHRRGRTGARPVRLRQVPAAFHQWQPDPVLSWTPHADSEGHARSPAG